MERDYIANDSRRARHARRLGPNACCTLCGISDPDVLRTVRRSLLEAEHVVGRAINDDLTVPLCRNCHAVRSEMQRMQGIELRKSAVRTLPEMVADVLGQLGTFLASAGAWLVTLAALLREFVTALDEDTPEWRELPEAQA